MNSPLSLLPNQRDSKQGMHSASQGKAVRVSEECGVWGKARSLHNSAVQHVSSSIHADMESRRSVSGAYLNARSEWPISQKWNVSAFTEELF